ncbi:hypothetical protein D3C72_1968180 [compost metagenome]
MILIQDAPIGVAIYTVCYALICVAIFLRVLLFERRGGDYRALPAWLAWGLCVASGSVPLRLVVGGLPVPDPSTVVLAAFLLCAVLRSSGSVQHLLPLRRATPAPARQTTRQELI